METESRPKITWDLYESALFQSCGFPGGSVVKTLLANAVDPRDMDSIHGLGRSLEEEMATHHSMLAWKILWTYGHKESNMTEWLSTYLK